MFILFSSTASDYEWLANSSLLRINDVPNKLGLYKQHLTFICLFSSAQAFL